ncbi:hypothetical protein ES288_A11G174300v1 [Gossypium darwinii]|uniref:Uncharacterized protein n=1 Tax=Gossypium darwinii TaxID=34276 RepID=A0A5D2EM17_GOSDA|nr:hypothetical protein ES288_A11G174300v1 [Gossypium darwinii]
MVNLLTNVHVRFYIIFTNQKLTIKKETDHLDTMGKEGRRRSSVNEHKEKENRQLRECNHALREGRRRSSLKQSCLPYECKISRTHGSPGLKNGSSICLLTGYRFPSVDLLCPGFEGCDLRTPRIRP